MQSQNINTAELLIEFLTEELPPINLEKSIGEAFASHLSNELKSFMPSDSHCQFFVTPRRFACTISKVHDVEPAQQQKRKGPAIASSLKDNLATPALLGFLKSCGLDDWNKLEQSVDGYFYATKTIVGRTLTQVLPDAIQNALKKLPIAKNMRWGDNDYSFVRPVHNLVLLYGNQVICHNSAILGCSPVDYTFGHRIMSSGQIQINDSSKYASQLKSEGYVITDFQTRKQYIDKGLQEKAQQLNLSINIMDGLLEEVTGLVEYPIVLQGEFSAEFLKVPQECLILSMAKNQKYFAMLDSNGKLSNKFLFVTNIASTNPSVIINGNQKVLAARLADAKFFYELDLKHNLADFVKKLENVVYHNKLGSQLQRIQRLQQIAQSIAPQLGVDASLAAHTAYLLKADLSTEMVGEFPELQGVMGKYYAEAKSENHDVANAIEKHYYPRFSGDELPDTPLATLMSLTDKLETIVGIWGIGLVPTGEKDPFALRRAALGIVRILLANELNLKNLLETTFSSFNNLNLNPNTANEVYNFIAQRLSNYLVSNNGYSINCVQSALVLNPIYFNHLPSLLDNLQQFAENENNKPLLNANKRISNILEKNGGEFTSNHTPKVELFQTPQEHALFNLLENEKTTIQMYTNKHNWAGLFNTLAKFNQPITDFFDNVMVMDKDESIRNNRMVLLQHLYGQFNQVCKLAELS